MRIGMCGALPRREAATLRPVITASVPAQQEVGTDSVQISDLSRAKLAELADSALEAERAEESGSQDARQQKLDDVREKISRGYYNNPDVLRKIADRITDNNDEYL